MSYHYRITVDMLGPAGEEGQSLSFFADTPHEIFATANNLRSQHSLSACDATKLAIAQGLLGQNALESCKFQES